MISFPAVKPGESRKLKAYFSYLEYVVLTFSVKLLVDGRFQFISMKPVTHIFSIFGKVFSRKLIWNLMSVRRDS